MVALLVVTTPGPVSAPGGPLVAEAVADHLRVVYREHPVDIESGGPHWRSGDLGHALVSDLNGGDLVRLAAAIAASR